MRAAFEVTDAYDYKMYVAMRQCSAIRPPYSDDFEVTPESKFADDMWVEPAILFASGHENRNVFNFYRKSSIGDLAEFTFREMDRPLVLQLKQAVVSFKFNRAKLRKRKAVVSPRTVFRDAENLQVLFANIAFAGVTSLKYLTPAIVTEIFQNLSNSDGAHDKLVSYFEYVMALSHQGLILDGVPKAKFSVELRESETASSTAIARTLEDHETSFLIKNALFYIDNAEWIINQLADYIRRKVSTAEMRIWLLEKLPIVSIGPSWYAHQLITAIRVSGYIIIAFHLGSRISEVLSADGDLAKSELNELAQLEKVIATLTIFKGTPGGKKRQYEVHPYILRVATVLRKLNEAIGLDDQSLLFQKTAGEYSVSVNNMNAKLKRFALMHGESFPYTSHSLRYSLADIVFGALDHPFSHIQRRLGHKFFRDAVRYGAHGPAGANLKAEAAASALTKISEFVEKLDEEETLGGLQGKRLSDALRDGVTKSEISWELSALGVIPIQVGVDEFCLKNQHKRGKCSSLTEDTFPEPEECSARCHYQMQFASRLKHWETFIETLDTLWSSKKPILSKIAEVEKLKENIVAWPELKIKLEAKVTKHPELRTWFV